MIMPDGISPKKSLFYVASLLLNELDHSLKEPFDVMASFREEYSLRALLLAFDWLFIANAIYVTRKDGIVYVSKKVND